MCPSVCRLVQKVKKMTVGHISEVYKQKKIAHKNYSFFPDKVSKDILALSVAKI